MSTPSANPSELLQALKIERSAPLPAARVRRPRWRYLALACSIIMLGGAGAWAAMSKAQVEKPNELVAAPPVPTAGTRGNALDASGYVVARRTATVSTQLTGVVSEVLFEEGDHVEEGQILARLDARSAVASLEAAQRQVAAAEQLSRQFEVQSAQAYRDGRRALELSHSGLVSRQDAEQALAKADELQAQVLSQRRNVQAVSAQANVARVTLDYAVVRAPFAGVITSKAAQVGEIVSPGATSGYTRTGIATIVDMNSLEVEVDVGEAYIGRVRVGMTTDVRLNAYPELSIPGTVIAIIPTADRGKATVKARIGLKLRDDRILPDMGARVSFIDASGDLADTHPGDTGERISRADPMRYAP